MLLRVCDNLHSQKLAVANIPNDTAKLVTLPSLKCRSNVSPGLATAIMLPSLPRPGAEVQVQPS
jgi:hypothetical protein